MATNVNQIAFTPLALSTVKLAASTASQTVQFQTNNACRAVRVYNAGSTIAFIEFGDNSAALVASATASMPIASGVQYIFTAPLQYAAVVMTAGSSASNVYFTPGEGVS